MRPPSSTASRSHDRRSEDEWTGTGDPLLPAEQRPAPLRELFARLQGGRLQPRPLGAEIADLPVRRPRRAAPRRWSAICSSIPEINNAYEFGVKYSHGPVTLNVTAFRQDFHNFQLNTFNGTVFLVQTSTAATTSIGGSLRTRIRTPPPPVELQCQPTTTGACAPATSPTACVRRASRSRRAFRPLRDMSINLGLTYANTTYRAQSGRQRERHAARSGAARAAGRHLSNAPQLVVHRRRSAGRRGSAIPG